jgi:hypothetical protein
MRNQESTSDFVSVIPKQIPRKDKSAGALAVSGWIAG